MSSSLSSSSHHHRWLGIFNIVGTVSSYYAGSSSECGTLCAVSRTWADVVAHLDGMLFATATVA